MKIDLKAIPKLIDKLVQKLRIYGTFILILLILGAFTFVVLRIRYYANHEPSQAEINQKLLELKNTQINQEAINKIEQLQSKNVGVKALFDNARDNPFHE